MGKASILETTTLSGLGSILSCPDDGDSMSLRIALLPDHMT